MRDNRLVYGGGMHLSMFGFYGDSLLVNGLPDRVFDVASRAYRLRILNGSTPASTCSDSTTGRAVTLLGVDGGLLGAPQQRPYVMLARASGSMSGRISRGARSAPGSNCAPCPSPAPSRRWRGG